MRVMAAGQKISVPDSETTTKVRLLNICAQRLRLSTAATAALGAEVDDPVCSFDDVEVVFDDDNGVAVVAQAMQHAQQQVDVGEMQTGGRLVKNVQSAAGIAFGQFKRQFDALGFAAGQVVADWPKRDIAKPTSIRVCSLRARSARRRRIGSASSTVMSSTSLMFLPLYCTSKVSRL
jgi:hypothetical protein